jgi:hypothetical protein
VLSQTSYAYTPDSFYFSFSILGAREVVGSAYHFETAVYSPPIFWNSENAYRWFVQNLVKRGSSTDSDITVNISVANGLNETTLIDISGLSADDTLQWKTVSDSDDQKVTGAKKVQGYGNIQPIDVPHIARMVASVSCENMAYDEATLDGTRIYEQNDNPDLAINPFTKPSIYDLDAGVGAGDFHLAAANMPCSAYLMKRLICDNSNSIAFKSTTNFSFPVKTDQVDQLG